MKNRQAMQDFLGTNNRHLPRNHKISYTSCVGDCQSAVIVVSWVHMEGLADNIMPKGCSQRFVTWHVAIKKCGVEEQACQERSFRDGTEAGWFGATEEKALPKSASGIKSNY